MKRIPKPVDNLDSLPLRIAGSANWRHGDRRLKQLSAEGFGIELAPDPEKLESLPKTIWPYAKRGVHFRFHGFFPGREIGNTDEHKARDALKLHKQAVDAVAATQFSTITCHIGLTKGVPISKSIASQHLGELVQYAKPKGVTIALENLKKGPTSDLRMLERWVRDSGAAATLDLGHALSCSNYVDKQAAIFDFIDRIGDRLIEVHFYEKETDRHYAPENMEVLGPIVDRLLQTACRWWTIELDDVKELKQTRAMVWEYLATARRNAM